MKKNEMVSWYLFTCWKHLPSSSRWELEEFRSRRGVENRLTEIIGNLHTYRIVRGEEYEATVLGIEIKESGK